MSLISLEKKTNSIAWLKIDKKLIEIKFFVKELLTFEIKKYIYLFY